MKTSIKLEGMHFFAYHGVSAQERKVGNDYEVSLRVDCPLEKAMTSDELADTLDYGTLYRLVADEMMRPSQLLEHVAGRIVRAIEAAWPTVTGGALRIAKLSPPVAGEIGRAEVSVAW